MNKPKKISKYILEERYFLPGEIRAILEDGETAFREIIDPQPDKHGDIYPDNDYEALHITCFEARALRCPYQKGDLIWAMEEWVVRGYGVHGVYPCTKFSVDVSYLANGDDLSNTEWHCCYVTREQYRQIQAVPQLDEIRPGDTMPYWASRLVMKVTRVEAEQADGDAGPWVWVVDFEVVDKRSLEVEIATS